MGKTYRLLIIDDNEELLVALATFFRLKEYRVTTAQNGLDGLKVFENEAEKFDLLITDLVMPHVSGVGLISIIKGRYPDFPVIAITGFGKVPEDLAAEAKADRIIRKPFDLVEIERIVKDLLDPDVRETAE